MSRLPGTPYAEYLVKAESGPTPARYATQCRDERTGVTGDFLCGSDSFVSLSPVFYGLNSLFNWMKHNGWTVLPSAGNPTGIERRKMAHQHQVVLNAGFVVHQTGADLHRVDGTAFAESDYWYALIPYDGARNYGALRDRDRDGTPKPNYFGFFRSLDDLVEYVHKDIVSRVLALTATTHAQWSSLSPLARELVVLNLAKYLYPGDGDYGLSHRPSMELDRPDEEPLTVFPTTVAQGHPLGRRPRA